MAAAEPFFLPTALAVTARPAPPGPDAPWPPAWRFPLDDPPVAHGELWYPDGRVRRVSEPLLLEERDLLRQLFERVAARAWSNAGAG